MVVNRGGVVYGARFDSEMTVVHARAESLNECDAFSGSKYVQSDMRGCMPAVAEDLRSGAPVLFSGTPCQVAGLRSLLSVTGVKGSLITVEIICHGVPSPGLWRDHLRILSEREGTPVLDYRFRDKSKGWHHPGAVAVTGAGEMVGHMVSAFSELFDFNYAQRPSCHVCPWARPERGADLTLGDYWGVERVHPELDDDMGVSLLLVHTDDGQAAVDAISESLELTFLCAGDFDAPNLVRPTPPSPDRAAFWNVYRAGGYRRAIRRFTSYGVSRRVLRGARRAARRLIRGG
jgi:coenzyme F420-reducing hydrogenase beta subunit